MISRFSSYQHFKSPMVLPLIVTTLGSTDVKHCKGCHRSLFTLLLGIISHCQHGNHFKPYSELEGYNYTGICNWAAGVSEVFLETTSCQGDFSLSTLHQKIPMDNRSCSFAQMMRVTLKLPDWIREVPMCWMNSILWSYLECRSLKCCQSPQIR